uniref:Globin family profile domain-containing protein n=1 Tax=Ascaris lumbricoides TaxID=6252 RepID=A0A9J2PAL8_ASCLU
MEGGVRKGIKITVNGREAGMYAEKEAANVDQRNRSARLVGCHGHIRAMGCRASTFHQRCKDHRQPVIDSWSLIYSVDSSQLTSCISDAWLSAAEQTPTWLWSLVQLDESMQSDYASNTQFMSIISSVRDFLHVLVKVHKAEPEAVYSRAQRLGARHATYTRNLDDSAYWQPFSRQLAKAIAIKYRLCLTHHRTIRSIIFARKREWSEEAVENAWKQFMDSVTEAMRQGYASNLSRKPLRLSLTNSIISMASVRSNRSRSHAVIDQNSPTSKNSCTSTLAPQAANQQCLSPSGRTQRSRSIIRSRAARSAQELSALRRLSSPNTMTTFALDKDSMLLTEPRIISTRRSLTPLP